MKSISSRDFQKSYAKLDAPTEVTAWGETIGIWVPRASDLFESIPLDIPEQEQIHPTSVRKVLPNGQSGFRTQVRVIDSVSIARQAAGSTRETWRLTPSPGPRGRR